MYILQYCLKKQKTIFFISLELLVFHPPGWLGSSKMTQQTSLPCFCWRAIIPKLCRSRDLTDEKNREDLENLYREQRSSRVLFIFPHAKGRAHEPSTIFRGGNKVCNID